MGKIYAGVGSRETPDHVLNLMTAGASELSKQGWALRSGHAYGADYAFESGSSRSEIHLPWASYNKALNRIEGASYIVPEITAEIHNIAAAHHPAWDRLSDAVKAFMYRNVTIVLGIELATPADMLVCWTPQGKVTGGTGHAMRVAQTHGIPIFNLALPSDIVALDEFISGS